MWTSEQVFFSMLHSQQGLAVSIAVQFHRHVKNRATKANAKFLFLFSILHDFAPHLIGMRRSMNDRTKLYDIYGHKTWKNRHVHYNNTMILISVKTLTKNMNLRLFIVLACHCLVLDGQDCHNQASVHFHLNRAINKSHQLYFFLRKIELGPLGPVNTMLTTALLFIFFQLVASYIILQEDNFQFNDRS